MMWATGFLQFEAFSSYLGAIYMFELYGFKSIILISCILKFE